MFLSDITLRRVESGSRNIVIGGQQGGGDGGTGEYLKNGDDNVFVGSRWSRNRFW